MTIGELLVKLRFSITGEQNLSVIENRLQTAGNLAGALATRLTIATTALGVIAYKALNASVALSKFQQVTGISSRDLQQWQYAAAKFGVAGDEVATTFKNIEQAQAGIALGEGNIAPWQLLNIDPRQDPRKVLLDIHDRIQGMQPAMARFVTSQMGIGEDMFVFLSQANIQYGELNKKFEASEEENKRLMELNGRIEQFKTKLLDLGIKIFSHFQKPLEKYLDYFDKWLDKLTDKQIDQFAESFVTLAQDVGYLTAALIALNAASSAFTIGTGLLKLLSFFGGGAAAAAGGAAAAGAGGATVAGEVVAAEAGGAAVAGSVGGLAAAGWAIIIPLMVAYAVMTAKAMKSAVEDNTSGQSLMYNAKVGSFSSYKNPESTSQITVNAPITVNGATNPQETSKAISDHITKTLGRVNVQTPQGYGKPATP